MRLANYSRTDYGADLGGYLAHGPALVLRRVQQDPVPGERVALCPNETVPDTLEFPLDGVDTLYSGKLTWAPTGGSTLVATVFGDPTTNSGAGAADPRQGVYRLPVITSPEPGTWESTWSVGAADFGLRFGQVVSLSTLFTLQAARHQDRYEPTPSGAGLQTGSPTSRVTGGSASKSCDVPSEPNSVQGGYGQMGGPNNNSASAQGPDPSGRQPL